MPPRITRNSHRPRASDRTMVDTFNHHSLVALSTRWRTPVAEKLMRAQRQNLQRSQWNVGWISRNQSPFRSRQNFFLDLPFYRTQNATSEREKAYQLGLSKCDLNYDRRGYNPEKSASTFATY